MVKLQSVNRRWQDRDNSVARQRELEREMDLLKERLDASQAGWAEARASLEDRDRAAAAAVRLEVFQRSVAELLSDGCVVVEPGDEERIVQRLRELLYATREKADVSTDYWLEMSHMRESRCEYRLLG